MAEPIAVESVPDLTMDVEESNDNDNVEESNDNVNFEESNDNDNVEESNDNVNLEEFNHNHDNDNDNDDDDYAITDAELTGIEPIVNDEPEARLLRFLYVGKEYADYQPGYWFVHNYFLVKNVPSIEELAGIPEKELVPIELITKVFASNLVPHPETLVFSLAVCCRQNISEKLRHAGYKAVEKICTTTEQFILFVRFISKLRRENELCYVTFGWGHGMKNAVNNWYMSKEPLALAKCVTKYRGRYGWKHKDIIKLCHIASSVPEKAVILKYVVRGLAEAQKFASEQAKDNSTVNNIMKYIETIEMFKHCEEESYAATLLQKLGLSYEHIPGHMLKSKKIWIALISLMDIVTLLNNLQRINNLRLLKPNLGVEKVIALLCNKELLARDKVHPAQILIAVINYQQCGKPLSFEKRRIREVAKKPQLQPEPNHEVISALYTAFYTSFSHLQRTNLRYLVTISLSKKTIQGHAWQCSNMTGLEVGCLIAMTLVRQEKDVTVATFKDNDISMVDIGKEETYEQIVRKLRKISNSNIKLGKPLLWAMKMKKEYDVFINIVDQLYEKHDKSQESLILYRKIMKLPEAKLINCAVCSSSSYRKTQYDKNVLIINGFDATVPILIQAFVQSLF